MNAIAVSLSTASRLVETSESMLREAIKAGDLVAYRVGRCIRIDPADLAAWLHGQPQVGSPEEAVANS